MFKNCVFCTNLGGLLIVSIIKGKGGGEQVSELDKVEFPINFNTPF